MQYPKRPAPLALVLALSLLLLPAFGCNGEDTPEPTTPEETAPEEDSLPFTEPETDTAEPYGGGTGEDFADTHENAVLLQNNQFVPDMLEVDAGVTVTFFNADSTDHNIQVGGEDLGTITHGETVEWTADEPGTYELICTIHPGMTGEIVVR